MGRTAAIVTVPAPGSSKRDEAAEALRRLQDELREAERFGETPGWQIALWLVGGLALLALAGWGLLEILDRFEDVLRVRD